MTEPYDNSVVRLLNYSSKAGLEKPWLLCDKENRITSGTAFFVGKNLLLTADHCVRYSGDNIYIFVAGSNKYRCKVVRRNYEIDLALIGIITKVPRSEKKIKYFKIAKSSYIGENLTALGYYDKPLHKIKCSVIGMNKTNVSPISKGLTINIKPTLIHGMSGGPVINKSNEIVGVCSRFEFINNSCVSTINNIIPFYVVDRFLKEEKIFTEIPFKWQPILNTNMIGMFGHGVIVTTDWKDLKQADQITHVDGVKIINGVLPLEKFINFKSNDVITFKYALSLKSEHVLTVNKNKKIKIKLPYHEPINYEPRFFNYGGLIFMPVTEIIIEEEKLYYLGKFIGMPFLADIIPTTNTFGYNSFKNKVVTNINFRKIKDFDDFVEKIKSLKEEVTILMFALDEQLMIVNRKQALKDTKIINNEYLSL